MGTALFLLAGLLLGRVQRSHHRTQTRLAASSLSDRLTGLYNYGTFVDYLHNEVTKADRYGGQLCLLMLDLDHFKQFNDRHGHEAGNELLRRLGATLRRRRSARRTWRRATAARSSPCSSAATRATATSWPSACGAPSRRPPSRCAVARTYATISAGVASYPEGAADETELIERADAALYESKRRGRNRVTIYAGSSEESQLPASLSA